MVWNLMGSKQGWRRRTVQYRNGRAVKLNTEGAEKVYLCAFGVFAEFRVANIL